MNNIWVIGGILSIIVATVGGTLLMKYVLAGGNSRQAAQAQRGAAQPNQAGAWVITKTGFKRFCLLCLVFLLLLVIAYCHGISEQKEAQRVQQQKEEVKEAEEKAKKTPPTVSRIRFKNDVGVAPICYFETNEVTTMAKLLLIGETGEKLPFADEVPGTKHSIVLSGLAPGKKYLYYIEVTDTEGNTGRTVTHEIVIPGCVPIKITPADNVDSAKQGRYKVPLDMMSRGDTVEVALEITVTPQPSYKGELGCQVGIGDRPLISYKEGSLLKLSGKGQYTEGPSHLTVSCMGMPSVNGTVTIRK